MLWHGWTADTTQRTPAGLGAAVSQNYICAYISAFAGWLFLLFRGFWDISHYENINRILLGYSLKHYPSSSSAPLRAPREPLLFFFFLFSLFFILFLPPSSPAPLRPCASAQEPARKSSVSMIKVKLFPKEFFLFRKTLYWHKN
jgi:hypothetical protein